MRNPYSPEYDSDRKYNRSQKFSFSFGVCLALMFTTAQPAWPDRAVMCTKNAPAMMHIETRQMVVEPISSLQSPKTPIQSR